MCIHQLLHKVRWCFTKEKGIEKFPRKLPTRENFKCVKAKTLDDLKQLVSNFEESLDEEEVRRGVRDVRPGAELCINTDTGHFKLKPKKYKEPLRSKNIKYAWSSHLNFSAHRNRTL